MSRTFALSLIAVAFAALFVGCGTTKFRSGDQVIIERDFAVALASG